jgi:hypothetical protein
MKGVLIINKFGRSNRIFFGVGIVRFRGFSKRMFFNVKSGVIMSFDDSALIERE